MSNVQMWILGVFGVTVAIIGFVVIPILWFKIGKETPMSKHGHKKPRRAKPAAKRPTPRQSKTIKPSTHRKRTMTLKPNGKTCHIPEQIIEDLASGLTLQFEVNSAGETRLHLYGESLPFGNRMIAFDEKGESDGGGTSLQGKCKPA